jgi:hypothetical protein
VNGTTSSGGPIEVHFNPWGDCGRQAGGLTPHPTAGSRCLLEFTSGSAVANGVELPFDSYERHHVSEQMVEQLEAGHPGHRRWQVARRCARPCGAKFLSSGVIESLQVKYTMFRQDGEPVRDGDAESAEANGSTAPRRTIAARRGRTATTRDARVA